MNFKRFSSGKGCSGLTDIQPLGMDAKALEYNFRYYYTYCLGRDSHCQLTHYPMRRLLWRCAIGSWSVGVIRVMPMTKAIASEPTICLSNFSWDEPWETPSSTSA